MRSMVLNSFAYAAQARGRFGASAFWPNSHVAACPMTTVMTTKISKARAALMR